MRVGLGLILVLVSSVGAVRADPIRYDWIPANVTNYAHVDVDRFCNSFLTRTPGASKDLAGAIQAEYGIRAASITIYSPGESKLVVIVHCKDNLRGIWEDKATTGEDALLFSYGGQKIYYCADNPWVSDRLAASLGAQRHPKHQERPSPASDGQVKIGIGFEPEEYQGLMNGPVYTAFEGQDLAVASSDLPSIAAALDVIGGKKPSLADLDPQGLKAGAHAGAIFECAGMTAEINAENVHPQASRPAGAEGGMNLDLFGTFKGKAKLARFDIGQNDQDVYFDASVAMVDEASATQLKNLIVGFKALISLSETDKSPLIAPLEIEAVGKNVVLKWRWPMANLTELFRLLHNSGDHGKSLPATNPGATPQSTP